MAENNVKNSFFTWQICAETQIRGYDKNGGIQ